MFRPASLALIAVLVGTPARAQDPAAAIDEMFSWATQESPGCAVAVSQHGRLVVNRTYGLADLQRKIPLTPTSVFDAGSIQKQFTAAAVLLLVEEGRLSLSDDVREHIPELPDYGHTITLDHLLTHTSGVRDWTGILPMAADDPDALTLTLRQRGLEFAPGNEWSYSSSGYELLKEIVARASGMPFADFTRQRLFEPLGMRMTEYRQRMRDGIENLAPAYRSAGETWTRHMLIDNERGGGALLTTASDLVIWNDALTHGLLGELVTEKLQEPARLNNGRTVGYARGLYLDSNRGGSVVWHSGGAAGYSALVARYPEQGLSVAITCNADGRAQTAYARRIFDLFVPPGVVAIGGRAEAPSPNPETAAVAGVDLTGRAGLFLGADGGRPLRVIVNSGRLGVAGVGPLVPMAGDRFRNPRGTLSFLSQAEFELRFLSQDRLELTTEDGDTTIYRRARPHTLSPADLGAFAGNYESDEIGTVVRISAGEGVLAARLEHAPENALEFRAVDRDTFMLSLVSIRFVRDDAGNVIGFDYSNPAVRSVRFTRLDDLGSGN